MNPAFPFSAIVGQETLKRALLLCVIQPGLGGALIRGTKGIGKSTAVRALANLLPPIETVAGCPFQRRPGETVADWPLPANAATIIRQVPLVELPLGATEDRVLGSLHLEKALRGERAFEPGLLAAANRGILYIDEVNLLPDHLVDILLDAAATGRHRLEREGLSLSHPARFVLIGTMNPEEGELRPQLLDRFGLAVDVADLGDADERAEAVRGRLAYEADPAGFTAAWQSAETAERERIIHAQHLLPKVRVSDETLHQISQRCLAGGVEGLRADLTISQAACAWAAYRGRLEVELSDVDAVAELALVHRRTRPPEPPTGKGNGGSKTEDGKEDGKETSGVACLRGPAGSETRPLAHEGPRKHGTRDIVFGSAGRFEARAKPGLRLLERSKCDGRRRASSSGRRTFPIGPVRMKTENGNHLDWAATLRAAAVWQGERGRISPDQRLILRPEDVRTRSKRGPAGCLLLFVIDASGSMAAWRRMQQTKAAVLALLVQAYQHRDEVAFLTFRDCGVELVLPPTRNFQAAHRALEELPVGGTTPLAQGLAAAGRFIRSRKKAKRPVWTVVLTDGRTNVPLTSRDPWRDALAEAKSLSGCGREFLVVDTEIGWPRFGRAAGLAAVMKAPCLPLEECFSAPLRLCAS